MRILIAEDDDVSRMALQEILLRMGHQVIAVDNGQKTMDQLLGAAPPKMVLLDLRIPGMSGLDVLQSIKTLYPDYVDHIDAS